MSDKEFETPVIQGMTFSGVYVSFAGVPQCVLSIDCEYHIDEYEYHDAPAAIDMHLQLDELQQLYAVIGRRIKQTEKMLNEVNDGTR